MSNTTTAVATTKEAGVMEFVPYGAADKIKLSISIIKNIVAVPTKTGATCSDRDAMKFMMLCQAQRLNPFAGDAFLVGYDGANGPTFSLITAHQAFLKRAETCEDFDGMTSGILLRREDDTIEEREGDFHLSAEAESVVGGWAKVFHKQRSHCTYRKIRMQRFNSGFAQWKVDPAGMIVKCAEADALRSTFPTLLGGLYAREEMDINAIEIRSDVTKPSIPSMFAAGTPQIAGTTPVSDPPPPVVAPTKLDDLRKLIEKEKGEVKEATIIKYMREGGHADDSLATLDEIFTVSPSAIDKLIKSWKTALPAIRALEGVRP